MKPKKYDILICVFIFISAIAVYAQVLNYDFVNFDDNEYITENQFVINGITIDSIVWAFTEFHVANWHPLTWISHMMDCQFFGLNAGWHHLTNLILHLFNSLLLYAVFRKMTGNLWQSGFVAALFALHPLHVESVAWISERKDVLSTFWAMLTILCYLTYFKSKNIYSYFGVIFFFSLGLMSKPMVVTLPFLLLLFDYWPLKRFKFQQASNSYHHVKYIDNINLFIEKLPLFFLSIISGVITVLAQQHGEAIRTFEQIPFLYRIANAFVSYSNYIFKMIYPLNLSVLYPYKGMPQWWKIVGSTILIVFISFFSIRSIKSQPYFIVGWFWFLGALIPVIGFIQVGSQSMADRYTYMPLIGLFMVIAWGVPDILSGWEYKKSFLFASSLCVFFVFMAMAWQQVRYWENGLTLSRRAVSVTSGNWVMEINLANMLARKGQYSQGIPHYIEALRVKPDDNVAYMNLISVLRKVSTGQSVAEIMKSVLSFYPKNATLYYIAGKMFRDEKNNEQSILYFEKTIQMDKRFIPAYYELATLYKKNNEMEKALSILMQVLPLQPDSPTPYHRIALIYQLQKKEEKASQWYRYAVEKGYEPSEKEGLSIR